MTHVEIKQQLADLGIVVSDQAALTNINVTQPAPERVTTLHGDAWYINSHTMTVNIQIEVDGRNNEHTFEDVGRKDIIKSYRTSTTEAIDQLRSLG